PFSATATAYDAYGNVKTDYNGAATVSSNLSSSAKGCSTGGLSPCSPSVAFDGTPHFTNGAALVDATAYKTESGRHLSISDSSGSPTVSADSNDFTVGPAALASFSWSHINDQTAGSPFSATATAYDAYGNVKTDYNNGAVVTSNLNGSPTGCAGPCTASVVFHNATHFSSGVAAIDATGYKAESGRNLTITDNTVTATSNNFAIKHAGASKLAFSVQPNASYTADASIAAEVTIQDAFSNTVNDGPNAGDTVSLGLSG